MVENITFWSTKRFPETVATLVMNWENHCYEAKQQQEDHHTKRWCRCIRDSRWKAAEWRPRSASATRAANHRHSAVLRRRFAKRKNRNNKCNS